MLKELFSGATASFFFKVLGGVLTYGASILVARLFGPEAMGLFYLSLSIVMIASAVSRIGLDQVMMRFISAYSSQSRWDALNGVYRWSIYRVLVASLAAALILGGSSNLIERYIFRLEGLTPVLLAISPAVLFLSLSLFHARCFQGVKNMAFFHLFQGLGVNVCFIPLLLMVGVIVGPLEVPMALGVAYSLATAFVMVLSFAVWRKRPTTFRSANSELRQEARSAAPHFLVVGLVGVASARSSELILGMFTTAEKIGIFSMALKTALLIGFIMGAANSIAWPKFSEYYHSGQLDKLKAAAIWTTRGMLAAAILPCVAVIVFPEQILLLAGERYASGATALLILGIGQLINVASGSVGGLLIMAGREREAMIGSLVSLATLVALSIFVIPIYGIEGAAAAYVMSIVVLMVLLSFYVKRELGFVPVNIFAKV